MENKKRIRSVSTIKCEECGSEYTTLTQTMKRTIKRFGRCVCPLCANKLGHERAKATMIERYGKDNPMLVEEFKNKIISPFKDPAVQSKIKEVYFEKTGYDNPGKNPPVREKMKKTCVERYGFESPMQNRDICMKVMQSACNNGMVPTSKKQLECFNMITSLGYDAILNYPFNGLSFDALININGILIDFEYDGWYWHQDKQKDCARNAVVLKSGFKIFRVKAFHDTLPTNNQLIEGFNSLINNEKNIYYIEI